MARTLKIKAATAEEASRIYCQKRDASGQGASTFPEGEWEDKRISYNGKVWTGEPWPACTVVYSPF